MPKEKGRNHTPNPDESILSCFACRRAHKKCDRKLPTCGRCVSRGWICNYDSVDRRFKPVDVMNQLNNNMSHCVDISNRSDVGNSNGQQMAHPQHVSNEGNYATVMIQHSMTEETIRIYLDIVFLGVTCFSREDYSNMLRFTVKELNENRKDVLALLLSIQCLCEHIFGFLEAAELTANKSRDVFRLVFEEFQNPFVASTCLNLASFYSVFGKVELARGYLALVEHFVSTLPFKNSFEYEFMEKYNCKIGVCSFKIFTALVAINCSDSYPIPDILSLNKLYSAIPTTNQPCYTNSDASIEKRIEDMRFFALDAFRKSKSSDSEISTHIVKVLIKIFTDGMTIVESIINGSKQNDIGLLNENTKLMEYYAYEIAKSCQDSASILVPPYITSFILIAIKLNFEIFKLVIKGERANNQNNIMIKEDGTIEPCLETIDYYSVVIIGLNTLKHLGERYPYISKIHEEMNTFIQKNRTELMVGNSSFEKDIQHFIELLYDDPSDIYHEMKIFIDNLKRRRESFNQ